MTIVAEVWDMRRYGTAPQFMGATGLVSSEHSTGERERRGKITKTGNAHLRRVLVEAAWHYRHRANGGPTIKKRRKGQPEAVVSIAERADQRLNRKFRRMVDRYNKKPVIAAVAVARELAGFIPPILHVTCSLLPHLWQMISHVVPHFARDVLPFAAPAANDVACLALLFASRASRTGRLL